MHVIEVSASRLIKATAALAAAVSLFGCANPPHRAPVEERSATPRATVSAESPALAPASAADAGRPVTVDSGPRPGFYTVKPGDTLIRIGLDNGQNWKDLVRWNSLDNPNLIEVGQTLRVVPPGTNPAEATSRPVATTRVEPRSLETKPAGTAASATSIATSVPPLAAAAPPLPAATPREGDDDIAWAWPVTSPVAQPFDESRNKGLIFRGKAGDPVLAAADGRVVYAGSGLRGYGNLVILKHNATYLTAYAHNQTLLVKDDQTVRKGQKIAEMGSTDADGVQLHFEIRKQGKPIDPAKLLPPR
ncbi:MAG: peptidoglycan DD-metalloendopeptidase family protein [Pseudomonadota bacterium]|nr:peptidoglycan DD-metalloendopeptidase family protein [Pseudomonadota bacterium]